MLSVYWNLRFSYSVKKPARKPARKPITDNTVHYWLLKWRVFLKALNLSYFTANHPKPFPWSSATALQHCYFHFYFIFSWHIYVCLNSFPLFAFIFHIRKQFSNLFRIFSALNWTNFFLSRYFPSSSSSTTWPTATTLKSLASVATSKFEQPKVRFLNSSQT